jgi:hypothetical protein
VNTKKQWGRPKNYTPKYALIKRISEEFNMTEAQAFMELKKIRAHFLEQARLNK